MVIVIAYVSFILVISIFCASDDNATRTVACFYGLVGFSSSNFLTKVHSSELFYIIVLLHYEPLHNYLEVCDRALL